MRFLDLTVAYFGCVRSAELELGPGLNVLFGPNDLGKSTLARAIEFALLVQHGSSAADEHVTWDSDEAPEVTVTFQTDEQRIWRVQKRFGKGARGASMLYASRDGRTFDLISKAREVDARVRELLGWGVASPGGRGAPRGLPSSFLGTVLLGRQADVVGVLSQTLGADTDDAGREQLTAALAAFAQDPVFRALLEQTQAKVDEAFTARGQRKSGRDSPFVKVADEVRQAREELERAQDQVAKSEGIEMRLQSLTDQRDELAARVHDLEANLRHLGEDHRRAGQRQTVQDELTRANAALTDAQRMLDAVTEGERALERAHQALEQARDANAQARTHEEEAEGDVRRAEEALRQATSQQAAQQRLLEAQRLKSERLEIEALKKTLERELDAVERVVATDQHHAQLTTELDQKGAAHDEARTRLGELDAARARAAQQLEAFELARHLEERAGLAGAIDAAESALSLADQDRQLAIQKRLEADRCLEQMPETVPSDEELAALEALERQKETAEARLGGGVSVAVALKQPLEVRVRVDGHPRDVSGDAFDIDAQQSLTLALGDLADIRVTAGDPEARASVEALERRWSSEAVPLLQRFSAASVRDLDAMMARVREARHDQARLRGEADNLDKRAAIREQAAAQLPKQRAELAALDRRLEPRPTELESARHLLEQLESAGQPLAERERALSQEIKRLAQNITEAERHTSALGAEQRGLEERRREAKRQLAELIESRATPDHGWEAEVAELRQRVEAQSKALAAIEGRAQALEHHRNAQADEAKRTLEAAQQRLEQVRQAATASRDQLELAQQAVSTLDGELTVRRESARAIDLDAHRARVAELEQRLAELPSPTRDVAPEDLERAQREIEQARRELGLKDSDIDKARGALETVGGQIAREHLDQAREALELAEQRQRDKEIEYDAWMLLLETLREAESIEGRHVGEALGAPVSQRFTELTHGRYAGLDLSPDLRAQGVRVAGMLRDIGALSVGTQEQLATLLRLTIAEHLESALVLDDHLAQTDPMRGRWFRERLQAHTESAQIIVLTCRPLDYVEADELPTDGRSMRDGRDGLLRTIDLTRHIERAAR